jgi:hypothetical protein
MGFSEVDHRTGTIMGGAQLGAHLQRIAADRWRGIRVLHHCIEVGTRIVVAAGLVHHHSEVKSMGGLSWLQGDQGCKHLLGPVETTSDQRRCAQPCDGFNICSGDVQRRSKAFASHQLVQPGNTVCLHRVMIALRSALSKYL